MTHPREDAGDIHVQSCIAMVLSQVSRQLGRFETAIKWAVTTETIKPENISTILNLGDTYTQLAKYDKYMSSIVMDRSIDPTT